MHQAFPNFGLTHPDRVYWQDEGITKQALAEFYADIANWVLPYVSGRVLSLVRCPSGDLKKCFYAKHAWRGMDDLLKPVDVGESEPMLAIDDLKGLIALVQAGVLEIHPWGSKIDDLERPDQFIIDLDPGPGVDWSTVIDAALEVRERLKSLKLKSFVKNSGGKGLHVVTPIKPGPDWETVKNFTKSIAEQMAADSPGRYVSKMTKSDQAKENFYRLSPQWPRRDGGRSVFDESESGSAGFDAARLERIVAGDRPSTFYGREFAPAP